MTTPCKVETNPVTGSCPVVFLPPKSYHVIPLCCRFEKTVIRINMAGRDWLMRRALADILFGRFRKWVIVADRHSYVEVWVYGLYHLRKLKAALWGIGYADWGMD